jgi:hypothetical protein
LPPSDRASPPAWSARYPCIASAALISTTPRAARQQPGMAAVAEAESVEDVGFFFRYVGGVKFRCVDEPITAPGYAHCVAVSNQFGVVAYSDLEGARPAQLAAAAPPPAARGDHPPERCRRRVRREDEPAGRRGGQGHHQAWVRRLGAPARPGCGRAAGPSRRSARRSRSQGSQPARPRPWRPAAPLPPSRRQQALDPGAVGATQLPLRRATHVSFSADELVLAVLSEQGAALFSVPDLLHQRATAPLLALPGLGEPKLLLWRPSQAGPQELLLLTDEGLYRRALGGASRQVAGDVTAAAWSPDGAHFAYVQSGAQLVVCSAEGQQLLATTVEHPDGGPPRAAAGAAAAAGRFLAFRPAGRCGRSASAAGPRRLADLASPAAQRLCPAPCCPQPAATRSCTWTRWCGSCRACCCWAPSRWAAGRARPRGAPARPARPFGCCRTRRPSSGAPRLQQP